MVAFADRDASVRAPSKLEDRVARPAERPAALASGFHERTPHLSVANVMALQRAAGNAAVAALLARHPSANERGVSAARADGGDALESRGADSDLPRGRDLLLPHRPAAPIAVLRNTLHDRRHGPAPRIRSRVAGGRALQRVVTVKETAPRRMEGNAWNVAGPHTVTVKGTATDFAHEFFGRYRTQKVSAGGKSGWTIKVRRNRVLGPGGKAAVAATVAASAVTVGAGVAADVASAGLSGGSATTGALVGAAFALKNVEQWAREHGDIKATVVFSSGKSEDDRYFENGNSLGAHTVSGSPMNYIAKKIIGDDSA